LSAVGLVLLLLPRFTPRAPRWAERFVPPRYRRRKAVAVEVEAEPEPAVGADEERVPVAAGVSGVNGATAVGPRSRTR
jgi:UDP-GlcNAc:undecaprenyl-phosphate GlcNAc-1-phosphate transferase